MEEIRMITLVAVMSVLLGLGVEPVDDWRFAREGDEAHRVAMDASELVPFDTALFAHLSDWCNGEPLNSESLEGKVVAIVFWSNADPTSVRAIVPTLKRLDMSYADEGLITLGVHVADHWEDAQERIESGLFSTLIAHDAEGAFAKALGADGTPDSFVIDRAGNLRFADLDDRDLPGAVRVLLRETAEEALQARERRIAHAEREQAKRRASQEQRRREADELAKMPAKPEAAAYASAAWPKPNKPQDPKRLYARDVQGKPLPVPFGTSEEWLTEKVPLEGRVVVLDFWATWCGPCIRASPKLDAMQKKYPDDLRVIGVAGQRDSLQKVKAFIKQHEVSYSHVFDQQQKVYRSLGISAIPHVVVLSTDGIVRWQGNPHDPAFEQVVEWTLKADPWVIARHESE